MINSGKAKQCQQFNLLSGDLTFCVWDVNHFHIHSLTLNQEKEKEDITLRALH